jgi:hypothetical protein
VTFRNPFDRDFGKPWEANQVTGPGHHCRGWINRVATAALILRYRLLEKSFAFDGAAQFRPDGD